MDFVLPAERLVFIKSWFFFNILLCFYETLNVYQWLQVKPFAPIHGTVEFLIPKRKFVFNFFQQYPEDPAEFKPLTEDEYVFITFANYTEKASKYIIS